MSRPPDPRPRPGDPLPQSSLQQQRTPLLRARRVHALSPALEVAPAAGRFPELRRPARGARLYRGGIIRGDLLRRDVAEHVVGRPLPSLAAPVWTCPLPPPLPALLSEPGTLPRLRLFGRAFGPRAVPHSAGMCAVSGEAN